MAEKKTRKPATLTANADSPAPEKKTRKPRTPRVKSIAAAAASAILAAEKALPKLDKAIAKGIDAEDKKVLAIVSSCDARGKLAGTTVDPHAVLKSSGVSEAAIERWMNAQTKPDTSGAWTGDEDRAQA